MPYCVGHEKSKREEQSSMRKLSHYRRPFLAAEQIISLGEPGRLEVSAGDRRLIIDIEAGDVDAACQLLGQLRQPDSEYWKEVRECRDSGLLALLDRLDRLGWLREGDHSGYARCANEADEYRELVRRASDWLVEAARCMDTVGGARQNDRSYTSTLAQLADEAAAHLRGMSVGFGIRAAVGGAYVDIAAVALSLMLYRWRRTSPYTLRIVYAIFSSAAASLDPAKAGVAPDVDENDAPLADARLVCNQVWSASVLAVLSAAQRYPSNCKAFARCSDRGGPGLNILIDAESAAERLVLARGPSPLLHLVEQGFAVHKLAVSVYLHQYLITTRYIEALYTFLEHNLRADLRTAGTRYLLEETGHEVHELEACRELGVSDQEMARFAPLPFFSSYPDVLGAVAEIDPVAFCLAVSVAEGLPGASKPIAAALAKQGVVGNSLAAHQSIDESLDHALVTRRLMRHVPWVEPAAALRAIQRFLLIVELSQLCWQQLAEYGQAQAFPEVPVAFGMSGADLLATFSRT
jgi:hypothetical protein